MPLADELAGHSSDDLLVHWVQAISGENHTKLSLQCLDCVWIIVLSVAEVIA